ncbi:hypothetical protein MycrhDRAFT_1265 [Mycolicibacterium rhodesiae JS60]|nr:hypothetical protein MycrhDRAFT_1265 [Mycolicibacterium rhodesiae JS60]
MVLVVTFIGGWWLLAGYVPPPSPKAGPDEIAAFFAENPVRIKIGLMACLVGSAFLAPFTAVISTQIKRIEGRHKTISYTQIVAGTGVAVGFTMGLILWYGAVYRPLEDPAITQRLNDLAWFIWVSWAYLPAAQTIAFGVAVLLDKRPDPVFPRWLGYLSFSCAVLYLPGGLAVFFFSGPFAWNGLITWWFLVVAYLVWVLATIWALVYRAIPHQQREEAALFAATAGNRPPSGQVGQPQPTTT